jgi:translocator protein
MRYAFLIAVVASIGFSAWASIPSFGYPLAGLSQADVSALYPNLVTPAPYAFSIWSLIYLSWIALAIAMFVNAATPSRRFVRAFGAGILLSAVWLVPFHYQYQ